MSACAVGAGEKGRYFSMFFPQNALIPFSQSMAQSYYCVCSGLYALYKRYQIFKQGHNCTFWSSSTPIVWDRLSSAAWTQDPWITSFNTLPRSQIGPQQSNGQINWARHAPIYPYGCIKRSMTKPFDNWKLVHVWSEYLQPWKRHDEMSKLGTLIKKTLWHWQHVFLNKNVDQGQFFETMSPSSLIFQDETFKWHICS